MSRVWWRRDKGDTICLEIPASKNGQHYTADGLTPAQVKWFAQWRAQGGVIHVVTNADEALRAIGARRD